MMPTFLLACMLSTLLPGDLVGPLPATHLYLIWQLRSCARLSLPALSSFPPACGSQPLPIPSRGSAHGSEIPNSL